MCRWLACTWFLLHVVERQTETTWATADGLATFNATIGEHNVMDDDVTPAQCLLRAWYFTLWSLVGIGYGDVMPRTHPEAVLQWVVGLAGE